MKHLLITGAMLVLGALPAMASAPTQQGRWEVSAAENFCHASPGPQLPGSTLVSLAVDAEDRVFIILGNEAWSLRPRGTYSATIEMNGSSIAARSHVIRVSSSPARYALSTDVSRHRFLQRFVSSSALSVQLQELQGGRLLLERPNLEERENAVTELLRCADRLKRRGLASARDKMEHQARLRGNPHGPYVSPTSKK